MPDKTLIVTERDGVRELRLRRPPRNRLDPPLLSALITAVTDADADPAVRAVVLAGADGVFSDGIDVPTSPAHAADLTARLAELLRLFPRLGTPVVAALDGDALQGGYALACAADIAVAVAGARIGTLEASYGMWPALAQVPALRRAPARWALQNVLTGDPYTAAEALSHGLVNEVVADSAALQEAVVSWTTRITRSRVTPEGRRAAYQMLEQDWDDALDTGLALGAAMGRLVAARTPVPEPVTAPTRGGPMKPSALELAGRPAGGPS